MAHAAYSKGMWEFFSPWIGILPIALRGMRIHSECKQTARCRATPNRPVDPAAGLNSPFGLDPKIRIGGHT
jgi:hypothetical protein